MKKFKHGETVEVVRGGRTFQARYVAPFPDGIYSNKVYEHIVVDVDTADPLVVSDHVIHPLVEEDGA